VDGTTARVGRWREAVADRRLAPLVHLARTPGACGPAPALGMHTEVILAELGYEAVVQSTLAARGVIPPLA
jgi:crotonobetainyl-CoA:carnitine CoA-transferase CaiB-like acyl-CoA transferase